MCFSALASSVIYGLVFDPEHHHLYANRSLSQTGPVLRNIAVLFSFLFTVIAEGERLDDPRISAFYHRDVFQQFSISRRMSSGSGAKSVRCSLLKGWVNASVSACRAVRPIRGEGCP